MQKGIMPRIETMKPERTTVIDEKIIFLNKENLAILEGYKVSVEMVAEVFEVLHGRRELRITLTGLSRQGADRLFAGLKEMKPEEVKGT